MLRSSSVNAMLNNIQPSGTIEADFCYGPNRSLRHLNNALTDMSTDTVKAKLSYSEIIQKVTLHISSNTEFNIPLSSST